MNKDITIGIPAFKAQDYILDCLASIAIQTIKKDLKVIIASDNPGEDYTFVKEKFPMLDITVLECEKNGGPGIARQRCLDACKTDWITFIDADDVFYSPFSIEILQRGIQQNVIETVGIFLQEVKENPQGIRAIPNKNLQNHPWVFGRLYCVPFLRKNGIGFSELRAMEDGELNWKIRMTIEGTPFKIQPINEPVYLWRTGNENSITRIGSDSEDGIPQYNYDLCQVGATIASIKAAKFCKEKNPFNGNVNRFIAEMMVGQYFTYIECLAKKEIFAEQNLFNAKRFYNECYKEIENTISEKILTELYTIHYSQKANGLIGIIPKISFFEFMEKIKNDPYGGEQELIEIRGKLPKEVIDNDKKTGVSIF